MLLTDKEIDQAARCKCYGPVFRDIAIAQRQKMAAWLALHEVSDDSLPGHYFHLTNEEWNLISGEDTLATNAA